ncbi:M14 family zinc carboxypeptidase [Burkholderia cenocepacia]
MIDTLTWQVPGDHGQPLAIRAWRLSGGDGPRVHLQAGVHADEIAGMLVLHRLLPQLCAAHDRGVLRGTVTIVPQANPLGLAQFRQGRLLGRFHEATHRNFNRHFHESAATRRPATSFAAWQRTLLGAACDADIVLDLHTDSEALPYLYLHRALWPAAISPPRSAPRSRFCGTRTTTARSRVPSSRTGSATARCATSSSRPSSCAASPTCPMRWPSATPTACSRSCAAAA